MKDVVEGKLEALPREPGELSWSEIWMVTIMVTCVYLMCMMLVHAAMVRA